MEQGQVNMIMIALLAVNIILALICVFKKGGAESEEEFVTRVQKARVAPAGGAKPNTAR